MKIMRKMTVAEHREKELKWACREYNIPYETGKHLMNCFYRLNADLDRLSYLENDSKHCNLRSTKALSESTDRRSKKLSNAFNNYGLCLDYFGHLATICIKGTTRTAIESFYYEKDL